MALREIQEYIARDGKNIARVEDEGNTVKVEECNEPSCEALIFPYGVVLFNIFSTICI